MVLARRTAAHPHAHIATSHIGVQVSKRAQLGAVLLIGRAIATRGLAPAALAVRLSKARVCSLRALYGRTLSFDAHFVHAFDVSTAIHSIYIRLLIAPIFYCGSTQVHTVFDPRLRE